MTGSRTDIQRNRANIDCGVQLAFNNLNSYFQYKTLAVKMFSFASFKFNMVFRKCDLIKHN